MPASKKYRDQMERLAQLEAEQAQRDREREAAAAAAPPRRPSNGGGNPPSSPPPPQVVRQQQQQQQVGLIGSLVLSASRHPVRTATLLASSFAYFNVKRAARQTGCIVSKSPYLTIWEPPVSFLAKLLNEELPSLPSSSLGVSPASFERLHRYHSKKEEGGREEGGEEGVLVRQSLVVGKGEVVFRKAAGLVRTLRLLDAASSSLPSSSSPPSSLGRFYSSEGGEEGVFVSRRRMVPGGGMEGGRGRLGQWLLMPVRIVKREGRVVVGKNKKEKKDKKKKGRKGKKAEEEESSSSSSSSSSRKIEAVYEEVLLRSLPGCPWKGELRLSASWRQAAAARGGGGKGEEDEVLIEIAWHTPSSSSSSSSLPPSFQHQVATRFLKEAQGLLKKEMNMYKVREKQQQQLALDAREAAKERRKKERQLLLNPPLDKKKWAKLQKHPAAAAAAIGGGGEKAGRWQPSADLAARRNPRKGG